jgi:hypothetical protein
MPQGDARPCTSEQSFLQQNIVIDILKLYESNTLYPLQIQLTTM